MTIAVTFIQAMFEKISCANVQDVGEMLCH